MSFIRSLAALTMLVAGCAQGGGSLIDSGSPPPPPADAGMDAGDPPGDDAGAMMGFDAGEMGVDAGAMMGTDAGTMMGTDAGTMMGTDAGTMMGTDAGCGVAADCNDGLSCNGTERCIGGACMAGTAFSCDDGVSCTRDGCVEGATPTCSFVADNSLCPMGQTCGATGCTATCAESPCRLVGPQCGCPGAQGCYLTGSTRICTAAGATAYGQICAGLFSCVPGGVCINVAQSGTAVNMCNRFCNTDSECAGGLCLYTLDDGAGGTVPGVTVCSTSCNPITRAGCPTGTACRIFRESMGAMRYFSDCSAPVGSGGQGVACTDTSDCQSGYGCVGAPGQCLQWCTGIGSIGAAGGCAAGLRCYGFMTPITIGGTTYGVCDL